MLINCRYYPCVFEDKCYEFDSHNETILSVFASLFQKFPEVREDSPCLTVRVNGRVVHPFEWAKPLSDGDKVLIIQEIGLTAALVFIGFTAATAATISTVITVALYVAYIAYTIYSYCNQPKAPDTGKGLNTGPTYGWDGIHMQSRQGVPVPIVYGEHLAGGNLISCSITSDEDKNYLNMLIALSEGEIEGIMKEDLSGVCTNPATDSPYVLVNDNFLSNFQGVTWDYRLGTQDQTLISGFKDICQIYTLGSPEITAVPYTYTTVDDDVEAFDLRFRTSALFATHKGNYLPNTIAALIQYKVHAAPDWIDAGSISITGSSQAPLRRFFRKDDLAPAQYDIRVTLTTSNPNANWVGELFLDNVTEIKYDSLVYPHTALLAIKVLATEQLSGQLPNVLIRFRGIKTLNLATSVTEWTNNPIYNVNDLLVNSRYGTGRYISQSNINNDQLILMAAHCNNMLGDGVKRVIDSVNDTSVTDADYDFVAADVGRYICCNSPTDATVFTTLLITSLSNGNHTANGSGGWSAGTPPAANWEFGEKRYELDLVIDSQNPAFDAINQICGSFRAVPIWRKDAIQLLIDKKESPSYIFNMGNILEGSFQHSFASEKSKPNCIEIDYADRDSKFDKATVPCVDYAAITAATPKRTRRMSLIGASRQSQVYREARFHLNAPKYQDEQITFKGAIDAIHMLPGDVVKFQHDVFQWGHGGRILASTVSSVTLDQEVTLGAGTYVITCKLADDTLETRTVTNTAGARNIITVSVAFTSAPPVYSLYAIGLTGVEAKPFRIMGISKTPENQIEVVATEYNDLVYADTNIVLAEPVYSGLPPNPGWPSEPDPVDPFLPPPDVTDFDATETTDITGVSITFTRPAVTTNWEKLQLYISRDNQVTWQYITTMYDIGPFIFRDVITGNTYWFKGISVSPHGVEGAVPATDSITMVGTAAVGITSLTAVASFKNIFLDWVSVAHPGITYETEIWRSNSNDRAAASLIASVYGTSYADLVGEYGVTRYYWVRNKNPNGDYSAWYPIGQFDGVSGTTEAEPSSLDTTPPATPTGLSLSTGIAQSADGTEFSWIRATWAANSEGDLSHYEYRIKETDGNYIYGYVTSNEALFQPVRGNILHYVGVKAIDKSGNKSAFCSDSSTTSSKDAVLPAVPTSFAAVSSFKTIFLTWVNPTDKDLSHINIYRGTTSTRVDAVLIAKTKGTFYSDEIGSYAAQRYYWIASEDTSGNVSATEAGPEDATTAYIAAADIGTFAITASKIYTKIPIITGDTWTDNSPGAGSVAWNEHTLYYNGVAYTIAAGNTALKYIYWLNAGVAYTASDTNPTSVTLGDGGFVIAVNISGAHDLAWNAIANQVIGSAYIQDLAVVNAKIGALAVDNAKINDLNATKINAGDIASARMQVQGGNAINAGSVQIDPGKILISGATSLSDWRMGGDLTKIDGGDISANTISANKLSIGSRNLSIQGIEISAQTPTANTLYWTAGSIVYTKNDGTVTFAEVAAGNQLWSGSTYYLYWVQDAESLSKTTDRATAFGANNVVLASYRGGTDLVVNYGRTIIDGSDIVTGTITANQLTTGELITESAQIKNLIVGTTKITGLAVTRGAHYYNAAAVTVASYNTVYEIGSVTVVTNLSTDWVWLTCSVQMNRCMLASAKGGYYPRPVTLYLRRTTTDGTIIAASEALGYYETAPNILVGIDTPGSAGSIVYKLSVINDTEEDGNVSQTAIVAFRKMMALAISK